MRLSVNRRSFLSSTALGGLALGTGLAMPGLSRAQSRPVITHGLQSGDVAADLAVIWARTDRPARMLVEVATTESFANPTKLAPLDALPESDFTVKRLLAELPADQDIFYRVTFADLAEINVMSEPMTGRFRTAPGEPRGRSASPGRATRRARAGASMSTTAA